MLSSRSAGRATATGSQPVLGGTRGAGTATAVATAQATAVGAARASTSVLPPWQSDPALASPAPPPDVRGTTGKPNVGASGGKRDYIRLAHLVCWQLAVAMVVASIGKSQAVIITISAIAAVLVALTAIRWGGRWLYQWALAGIGYLFRRRRHRASRDKAPAATLLEAVCSGSRIDTIMIDDAEVGVITHAGGATVILEPSVIADPSIVGSSSFSIPAPSDLLPLSEPDDPIVSVQLILHTVPALGTVDDTNSAVASYRQLTANRIPIHQSAWFAVQIQRSVDHYTNDVLHKTLASVTRRLVRRMRKEGHPLNMLSSEEIMPVVGTITHLEPRPPRGTYGVPRGPAAEVLRERWKSWWTSGIPHTTFRFRHLEDLDARDNQTLVAKLNAVPTEATTIALATRREGDNIEAELVLGVTMRSKDDLKALTRTITSEAAYYGATVARLDGYQQRGIAALLPLGGFLPW